jgi:alcohol dehydrogenase, propanol-preferring
VDLAETFDLHAAGKTRLERETRELEEVNEAFDQVDRAKAKACLVFDFR